MKITATVSVTIERTDGTSSRHDHTSVLDCGDNPRFENAEVNKAINRSVIAINRSNKEQP